MKKILLIIGASRGIGAELAKHYSSSDCFVYGVSRSRSNNCQWIEADISTSKGIQQLVSEIGNKKIDALIFSAGVWEEKGFMADFDFLETADAETRHIMSVNVVAPIEITKLLAKNLSQSDNPRAIYLGAISGIGQRASKQVAYSASKFALRGAIQSLSKALKLKGIGFTVINPGNVATDEVMSDIKEGRFKEQIPIPVKDIVLTTEWILSLSKNVEIGDINLDQKDNRF